jgi:hypothetical protein
MVVAYSIVAVQVVTVYSYNITHTHIYIYRICAVAGDSRRVWRVNRQRETTKPFTDTPCGHGARAG